MAMRIVEDCWDFAVEEHGGGSPKVRPLAQDASLNKGEVGLSVYAALMGESEPKPSAFSANVGLEDAASIYRFDWIFGVSCPKKPELWWDWQKDLRKEKTFSVQLLLSTKDTGFSVTELSASLYALTPSKNIRSWLESHSKQLADTLVSVAGATQPLVPQQVGALLRTTGALSNFIASGTETAKNWHIYRFLDSERRCPAIEWNIGKTVVEEFGPMLRGSFTLAFHGAKPKDGSAPPISLDMRAALGYFEADPLKLIRTTEGRAGGAPLRLEIRPQAA